MATALADLERRIMTARSARVSQMWIQSNKGAMKNFIQRSDPRNATEAYGAVEFGEIAQGDEIDVR
jgi:hypothetical protein